jgi:serine/threonine protein kinase
MLSAELGAEEELHQRFQREAEAIGRLNHPNVVTVYDLGHAEGQLYMAMELLEGDDLRSLIDARADVPLADRVRILIQICVGLGYAHSRGVIHRDVKPANIHVSAGGKVKLLDFGLARVAQRETITRRGVILGTPDYMAPEQATGKGVDHRSDIFSAGAVFYEFLTLEKPFKGKTLHAVLYQIIQEDPDPLLTVNPEVPVRLAAVVHGMLRKDPDRRYQSMDDVGRDLSGIHDALRRSRSRSALYQPSASLTEDARALVRDHVARSRAHMESGRNAEAIREAAEALATDPASEEAAEITWRSSRQMRAPRPSPPPSDPRNEARVKALLARAGAGRPDTEARPALAELALIAPDDTRVVDLLRSRGAGPR